MDISAELKNVWHICSSTDQKSRDGPKHIERGAIKACFANKEVGNVVCLPSNLDRLPAYIHCMKEHNYETMLMAIKLLHT